METRPCVCTCVFRSAAYVKSLVYIVGSRTQASLALKSTGFCCCTMVRKAATTNIKTTSKSQRYKKQAEEGPAWTPHRGLDTPTKPLCPLVRKGMPKKYSQMTPNQSTFQKMDWSELNSWGVYGFEPNGYGCTAEYFLAHQLVGGAGHNWAFCIVDAKKVVHNDMRLNTLTSGTKVEHWRVSDIPETPAIQVLLVGWCRLVIGILTRSLSMIHYISTVAISAQGTTRL